MLSLKQICAILPDNTRKIYLAYSGGVDSHVLLHLLSSIPSLQQKIVAVYIHHGLQIEADLWELHCKEVALASGVEFKCIRVNADRVARQSLEEVARNARYQVLKSLLKEHDVLLVAQHQEDQMETVLLQLFRGAGIQGLSGMPLNISFGLGRMIRPLLDVPKQQINQYAQLHQLNWIEDPSNQSNDFDRNYLRNQIIPQLKQRWPSIDKTVARSARHCANSQVLVQSVADKILTDLYDASDNTLNIKGLLSLDLNRKQLVLRQWFGCQQLRMPSEKIIHKVLTEVIGAKVSANPELKVGSFSIRRYRDKLYCISQQNMETEIQQLDWVEKQNPLEYRKGYFISIKKRSSGGIDQRLWDEAKITVKPRTGAEKIALYGRQGRHTLKKLFQEKGIPPWERNYIPLVYLNGQLAAVGHLWVSSDFYSVTNDGYQLIVTTQ